MKSTLVKWGIPSLLASIVAIVWMIGTTPVMGDLPLMQYWHKHFVDSLNKPTPMDLANNDKTTIQKYYMGVQYQLDKHKTELKEIEKRHPEPSVKYEIEMELWKTERDQLQKQIDYWLERTQENQSSIDMLIAGS